MATVAQPYGLEPVQSAYAGYNTQGFSQYAIASGFGTNIFFGDLVKLVASGTIERYTVNTEATIGVFLGAEYTGDPALNYRLWGQYWPAGTTGTGVNAPNVKVLDDPNAVFKIQATAAITQADVGQNAGVTFTAGSTANGKGAMALDQATLNTTATLPLRILGFWSGPESTPGDAFTDCIVKLNNHRNSSTTGI